MRRKFLDLTRVLILTQPIAHSIKFPLEREIDNLCTSYGFP